MSTVKINQKNYTVPELNFRHSKLMEQMGLPLEGMMSRQYVFTAVSAFTAITVKCEPEQADYLLEQHVMGGGTFEEIYKAFVTAVQESAFFKKLLHLDEQEKSGKKSTTKKTVRTEATTEENL